MVSQLARYSSCGPCAKYGEAPLSPKVQEKLSQVVGKAIGNLRGAFAAVSGIAKLRRKPAPPAALATNLKALESAYEKVLGGEATPTDWADAAVSVARAIGVEALRLGMEDLAIGLEQFATRVKDDVDAATEAGLPKWVIPVAIGGVALAAIFILPRFMGSKRGKSALGDEIGPYDFEPEEQLEGYRRTP